MLTSEAELLYLYHNEQNDRSQEMYQEKRRDVAILFGIACANGAILANYGVKGLAWSLGATAIGAFFYGWGWN
jgi:hypothetical protein